MSKKLIALFIVLLLALSACSISLASDVTPPPNFKSPTPPSPEAVAVASVPLLPPDPAQGAAIFPEKCAPCHGVTGMGNGPQAAQLPNPVAAIGSAEFARKARPSEWYNIVTNGNVERFMMPFRSLTDRQRWDVVAYLYTLSAPPKMVQQGKTIYDASCTSCHGAQGKGDGSAAAGAKIPNWRDPARLAGRSASDLFQVISNGVAPTMQGFASQISEDDRWALTAYIRTLSFANPGNSQSVAEAATQAAPGIKTTPAATSAAPPATSEAPQTTPASGTPPVVATIIPFSTTVNGKVTVANGAALPAGLKVTLNGFDNMAQTWTAASDVNADGTFRFDNVQVQTSRTFMATIDYQKVSFTSTPLHAADMKPEQPASLTVAVSEVTADTQTLTAQRMHLFFDFSQAGIIQVGELFVITNSGGKAVAASAVDNPALKFELPKGAQNLSFQDGALGDGRYVKTDQGFGDLLTVHSNEQVQVIFGYEMPYTGGKQAMSIPVTLPVEQVVVMVPSVGITLDSSQLNSAGTRDVQGTTIQLFTSGSLAAGSKLDLNLSGAPQANPAAGSSAGGTNTNNLVIGLGAFGLVLVVAGVWLYSRRRTGLAEIDPAGEEIAADQVENTADSLLDAIVALDDLYQAGQLPETAYQQRRAELKARYKSLREN